MSNGRGAPVGSFQYQKQQEKEWRLKNMGEALGDLLSDREASKADTMAGVKGGAIGFALGSIVAPGIGSRIGASIGAGFGRWKAGQKGRSSSLAEIRKKYGGQGIDARALFSATRGEIKRQDKAEIAAALGMAKSAWELAGSAKGIKAGTFIGEKSVAGLKGLSSLGKDLGSTVSLMGKGAEYGIGHLLKAFNLTGYEEPIDDPFEEEKMYDDI